MIDIIVKGKSLICKFCHQAIVLDQDHNGRH